jgi:hypothetical protein
LKNLFGGSDFKEDLTLDHKSHFLAKSLELFRVQSVFNSTYKDYISHLGIQLNCIDSIEKIPFLPIGFFKTHVLKSGDFEEEAIFESSGTTSTTNSRHFVKDTASYLENATTIFNSYYGSLSDYCILALLPSYLERSNSSLVHMVDHFVKKSGHEFSGFFLYEHKKLYNTLLELERRKQPTILFGVTFALLDFADKYSLKLDHTIVLETGGMKGRRKEITKDEMHTILKQRFGLNHIHAEYGMTELLSQAYSFGDGIFRTPSTMRILLRSLDDPFDVWSAEHDRHQTGVINIIDLANKDSIAFIATDDLGRFSPGGGFQVVGRVDNSDIRGCSLLSV